MQICLTCKKCHEDSERQCDRCGSDRLTPGRNGGCLVDGKYHLDQYIGHGGMGFVYKGTDRERARAVAIKLLRLDNIISDPKRNERFRREGNTGSLMRHPNVVKTYAYNELGHDEAYIVMEFLEGPTLREYLKEHKVIPVADAIRISWQVAAGIEAAHFIGIMHRDLKPENIILTSGDDKEMLVKVLDFGLAKRINPLLGADESSLTSEGVFVGSAHYTSPENCKDCELDARSDIYSLGIISYEMLAGQRPFNGTNVVAICHQHAHEEPPPLGKFRRDLHPDLVNLITRSLNKNPALRPQSAAEFAYYLHDIARQMTPSPFSPTERIMRLYDPASGDAQMPINPAWVKSAAPPVQEEHAPKTVPYNPVHGTYDRRPLPDQLDPLTIGGPPSQKPSGSLQPPKMRRRRLLSGSLSAKRKVGIIAATAAGFLFILTLILVYSFRGPSEGEIEAHLNQGISYLQMGQHDWAIAELNEVLRLEPKHDRAYLHRGIAYSRKGQLDQGIDDFTKAIQFNSKLVEAYENRGHNYVLKNLNEMAVADYGSALAMNPSADIFKRRGEIFYKMGLYDKAITDLSEAIKLNPQNADSYSSRAKAHLKIGNRGQAKSDNQKAKQLRKTIP